MVDRFLKYLLSSPQITVKCIELAKLMRGRARSGALRKPKVTFPAQVRFDGTSSSHSTLLELITYDRPGLLYQVSSVLAELGCNIEIALIDTEGEKVIDVFYLTSQGRKLRPELQEAIAKALLPKP
jgi:[protein-PII] uridylyltransferase